MVVINLIPQRYVLLTNSQIFNTKNSNVFKSLKSII